MNEQITDMGLREEGSFDLSRTDGMAALRRAEEIVKYMADKCAGHQFVSNIQGKKYPRVEWWTTVGAAFGLFPQELSSKKLDREEIAYEGIVEVMRDGRIVSRASAICSASEKTWSKRDEYAIKSMATTRATGKAYRIAFSFLAVMAGLEPTPAEEMPHGTDSEAEEPSYTSEQWRTGITTGIDRLIKKEWINGDEHAGMLLDMENAGDNIDALQKVYYHIKKVWDDNKALAVNAAAIPEGTPAEGEAAR